MGFRTGKIDFHFNHTVAHRDRGHRTDDNHQGGNRGVYFQTKEEEK